MTKAKHTETEAVDDVVAQQEGAGVKEIIVPKADWDLCGLWLQEAINYARYDLLEPPEPIGRSKLVIAIKRARA